MSNTESISNNNSDLVQGPCPTDQSEELDMAIDKDELIALAKKFIERAEFDFINKPISETCRFLSLKNMTVIEPRDRYNASKEIADIVEKVFDDYLANEISKRERKLFEKKFANQKSVSTVKKYDSNRDIFVIDNEEHQKPLERTCKSEEVIAAVKKIASGYIYGTEWAKNGDPSIENKKLQYLESQARDEVIRLYGLDDELLYTVSDEFKEFYRHHPTIFFPTKPLERTCENEDIVSVVKSLAAERLERFKFQANERPEDAYERLKHIESQVKDDVTSIYGKNYELLDVVTDVFEEFYEVHGYKFFTGNKEPQEITDPVCASADTDEKDETMELACDTEDTDAKPEEAPEEELVDIEYALTPDKKTAKVTEIANECVENIRFGQGEGKLVDLLRVVDAERKAASRVYELYGEDKYAIEELSKFFKRCYEWVEQFYSEYFKEEALVMPEPADTTELLDRIYNSISRIVKECMSGTELEYNDGSDYDLSLIQKVSHDIKSKLTEMFGDNKAIQNFANDMFRDRLAGAPKVESTTVPAETSGKEDGMVRHVVITDEEKVAVVNKIAHDCVSKINFSHNEGEAIELLRMFEAEREATSKVVEVYGDDKVALNAIHEIFNCLYENIKQFYEGEPKEAGMVRIDDPTHEEKIGDITKIANEYLEKYHFDPKGDLASNAIHLGEARYATKEEVKELYRDDADALKIMDDLFEKYDSLLMKCHEEKENDGQTTDETTETPTKDKYDLSPEDAEKVNQSIERIKAKAGIDTETSESLTKDKIKQLVRSKTEEVFGIGNEDAINAVWSIFDRNPYCPIREDDLEIFIKRAILCYIAKEAVDYSDLRLSENKSDEQTCLSEVKKEAIEKAKEIYGDDKELLDYVVKVVNLYADFITNQKFYKEEKKKQSRPMPIITKPIGRRIPGMSHIVQQRPLSTTENMDNILLSKEEQKQLKAAESEALNNDSMVNYSDPSGKEIENLITKIYGERSRKNLPKESQEQSEQKEYPVFFDTTMSLGLARRIWKEQNCDGSVANIVEPLLDGFYPEKEYQRPYKYGAVVLEEIVSGQVTESSYADSKKLNCFCSVLKYYNNWIDNYYGQDVKREESDLKFSIHRVHPEPDKYDYVVIENSHSTRPLSFPTKDMADNFLIVFRDLIEAAGNLI